MELRRVDPRILKANAHNPRKIQPGEMSDAALAASINTIGILQPPTVTESDGELTIAYGARRVRIAIQIGLSEIDVLVKDPDDHDQMRAVSENVVRAPMAVIDLWRSIESLASENWTEEAIASALAIPVRQIRKLRLLATVHPAILDQIGAGDMPREQELRTIASARGSGRSLEEAEAEEGRRRSLVEDRAGARKDPLLRKRRKIRRGRTGRIRHRLAGGPVRRRGRGQSLHCRRRGFRVGAARLARRPHAQERRFARD
jgi:ParB/RepB/Spo0J family partition protein